MNLSFSHSTTQCIALGKLKKYVDSINPMDVIGTDVSEFQKQWEDNTVSISGKAFGSSIFGSMSVSDKTVDMNVTLPLWGKFLEKHIGNNFEATRKKIFYTI